MYTLIMTVTANMHYLRPRLPSGVREANTDCSGVFMQLRHSPESNSNTGVRSECKRCVLHIVTDNSSDKVSLQESGHTDSATLRIFMYENKSFQLYDNPLRPCEYGQLQVVPCLLVPTRLASPLVISHSSHCIHSQSFASQVATLWSELVVLSSRSKVGPFLFQ